MLRKSPAQRHAILTATSALALIAGLGGNALACQQFMGPNDFPGFENVGPLDCVSVSNHARVHGNVSNASTGVIGPPGSAQPATVSIDNSTISGAVQNSGMINASGGTPGGISVTGGSVVANGIVNNSTGTISVSGSGNSAFGIKVSQASFGGGITNSGVIVVNNSSGSAVGIQIGGSSPPPPPPAAPIATTSLNTSTVTTTNNNSGTGGGNPPGNKHQHH